VGASGARRGTGPAAVHPPRPRNDTLNLVAFKVAQLVGAAALDEALVAEVLVEGGTVTGLSEREVAATVRSGRAGVEHPRRPGQARPRPPVGRPAEDVGPDRPVTARDVAPTLRGPEIDF
jgi:hypothetical protein